MNKKNYAVWMSKASLGLSFGLSIIFTIWFWKNQATGNNLQVYLFAGCGALFEITKFFAFPQGVRMWRSKEYLKAISSMVMGLILSGVSIVAAISVIQEAETTKTAEALKNNHEYTSLQTTIAAQMQTIANLNFLIQEDINKQYRERAKSSMMILEKEQTRLDNLQRRLQQIQVNNHGSNVPERVKNMFLIVLGSLLEITTCYLLVCSYVPRTPGTMVKKPNKIKGLIVPGQEQRQVHNVPRQVHRNIPQVHYLRTDRLADQIRLAIADHNCSPNIRNIKNQFKVGTEKAQTILQDLYKQGLLSKQGRGYILAHG